MNKITALKVVLATLVAVGIVVGFTDLYYAPHTLAAESTPDRPWWLSWLGWLLASLSSVLYIVVDYLTSRASTR